MTHVHGFLSGLMEAGAECEVYCGTPLNGTPLNNGVFPEHVIRLRRRPYFFWEARALAYNSHFVRTVKALFKERTPTMLYQRHGRFVVAGALLARMLKVPLVLEYNGSEIWVAENWDPVHFRRWLQLCEEYSLRSASLIAVVSKTLREELIERGIAAEKIIVNPNGVDPHTFQPGCGGAEIRRALGLTTEHIVACFVGTFSYWHGIPVLEAAAERLLSMAEQDPVLARVRFLLVGDGPLRDKAEETLRVWIEDGKVIFAGSVPHGRVPAYLDAADILLSPHIPFADGSEFFGSPTKLFEYMAMGKAIVASKLGQIGDVLVHAKTGLLVTPGNVEELVAAVSYLAHHPDVGKRLGACVRQTVIVHHTWRRNAERVVNFRESADLKVGTAPIA